jgi:hypothetical protein
MILGSKRERAAPGRCSYDVPPTLASLVARVCPTDYLANSTFNGAPVTVRHCHFRREFQNSTSDLKIPNILFLRTDMEHFARGDGRTVRSRSARHPRLTNGIVKCDYRGHQQTFIAFRVISMEALIHCWLLRAHWCLQMSSPYFEAYEPIPCSRVRNNLKDPRRHPFHVLHPTRFLSLFLIPNTHPHSTHVRLNLCHDSHYR